MRTGEDLDGVDKGNTPGGESRAFAWSTASMMGQLLAGNLMTRKGVEGQGGRIYGLAHSR